MIDQVVMKYIELRDMKAQLKAEYEAKVAPVQAAMDKAEAYLLSEMSRTGTEAFKTSAGTAYISTKTGANIANWDLFKDFLVAQEDPYMFLDRRVNKTAVEEFSKENADLPPGINWRVERSVNVRRA